MFKDNEALTPTIIFIMTYPLTETPCRSVTRGARSRRRPAGRKGAAATPGRCRCEHRYVRGSGGTSPDRSLLLPLAAFGSSLSGDKV